MPTGMTALKLVFKHTHIPGALKQGDQCGEPVSNTKTPLCICTCAGVLQFRARGAVLKVGGTSLKDKMDTCKYIYI